MGDFLAIIPVLWTPKYTSHISERLNCGPRQGTQTTKGITKSLFQMSMRDIHSEQELLFIGNSEVQEGGKAQYIHIWKMFSLFVMCKPVSLSIDSAVMALGGICRAPNNPEGKGRQQVTELGGSGVWQEENIDFTMFSGRVYWQGGCDLADLRGAPLSFQGSCCGTSSICTERRRRAFPRWAVSPGRRRLNLSCQWSFRKCFMTFRRNKLIGSAEGLQSVQVLLYSSPRIQALQVTLSGTREYLGANDWCKGQTSPWQQNPELFWSSKKEKSPTCPSRSPENCPKLTSLMVK